MAKSADSDMLRLMGCQANSRRKVVRRASCLIEGVYTIESQDSHPRKSIPRKEGKLGSTRTVNFSKGTWHHIKKLERKGPSQGVTQKCERNPGAPSFEQRTQDETLHQERCARRVAWDLAKSVYKLKKIRIKLRFTFRLKPGQRPRPLQNLHRNENSWVTPEHQCTC